MPRDTINDLQAFVAVAREQSFTKAATKLGVSQSALSHTVRGLEAQLGLRLLTRTTRSVAPTAAGERLLTTMGPLLDEIETGMAALSEFREKPAGTIRITTGEHAAHTVLWPALERLLPDYPDIKVELDINNGMTDIVAGRYDAGVRLGEQVAKDMVAVRIGPEARMAVVGAPSYFTNRPRPETPQDLTAHDCINLRMPSGGLLTWEFEKDDREVKVRSKGGSCSTTRSWPLRRRWADTAWRTYSRTVFKPVSPMDGWSGFWRTGARRSQAITCTTRAAGNPRRPSPCWWIRCGIAVERDRDHQPERSMCVPSSMEHSV
jgi:DNA-binding transcriptional LysR family regulator